MHLVSTPELDDLRIEQSELNHALQALEKLDTVDRLQVQRLKNRLLFIKTKILTLEDALLPDILA